MSGLPEDLYAVLGVLPTASPVQINRAYRTLLRRHHPDTRRVDADPTTHDEALRMILVAYAVLHDPRQRSRYDHQRLDRTRDPRPSDGTPVGRPQPIAVRPVRPITVLGDIPVLGDIGDSRTPRVPWIASVNRTHLSFRPLAEPRDVEWAMRRAGSSQRWSGRRPVAFGWIGWTPP